MTTPANDLITEMQLADDRQAVLQKLEEKGHQRIAETVQYFLDLLSGGCSLAFRSTEVERNSFVFLKWTDFPIALDISVPFEDLVLIEFRSPKQTLTRLYSTSDDSSIASCAQELIEISYPKEKIT